LEKKIPDPTLQTKRQVLHGQINEFLTRLNGDSQTDDLRERLAGLLSSKKSFKSVQLSVER